MASESSAEKVARFERALNQFVDRVSEDDYVLAVVLAGSLSDETIWKRDALNVWVIEADGVSRRLRSDGNDEHIHRIFAENEINIYAELIPRSRFKQMVEGTSRTAFSCNFFQKRTIVHSKDPSIDKWFTSASEVAMKDKQRELVVYSTWTICALKNATRMLNIKKDLQLAQQEILNAAYSVAYTEVIRHGEICEDIVIYRAIELNPELMQPIYQDVLAKPKNRSVLETALSMIDQYLENHCSEHLKPITAFLKKENRLVPLSEIGEQFAFSQIYPWHIQMVCDWLEKKGKLEKLSAPFKLTKRSHEGVEEPAYSLP